LLVKETGLGCAESATRTSAMPSTVVGATEILFTVFGSADEVMPESVAGIAGDSWRFGVRENGCTRLAFVLNVPILNVTRLPFEL